MTRTRVSYVDWMRGFAVLIMMQTHAYDSWLTPEAKTSDFYGVSRLVGGYPAPLFLFLAGLGLALLGEALHGRGQDAPAIRRELLKRGLEVFGYAIAFRVWMFTTSGFTRLTALVRVDVLNCIGVSMLLVGALALGAASRRGRLVRSLGLAAGIALLTPFAWDLPWPDWIPFGISGYWTGRVHGAYFPLFPWAGFVALGAAVGIAITYAREAGHEGRLMARLALAGALAIPAGLLLKRLPSIYPKDDFWWTSPSYFLIKCGVVVLVLAFAYLWGLAPWAAGPSPVRLLGHASLLVYWVHIEIVYGAVVAPALRHSLSVGEASAALFTLTLLMIGLAYARNRGPLQPGRLRAVFVGG